MPNKIWPDAYRRPSVATVLDFCSKIVTYVADLVPLARENFKTAGHFPHSAYKVLALAGSTAFFRTGLEW